MHSGAAVEAFQAALNRDIEGDVPAPSQTSESDAGILQPKLRGGTLMNRYVLRNFIASTVSSVRINNKRSYNL